MCIYGSVRGTLVDLDTGCVVTASFGYTPTAVTSHLKFINGKIAIKDSDGGNHVYFQDKVVILPLFESVLLRVIWYNNELLILSHRKINPKKSFWGASDNFLSLYYTAGGPSAENLFDTTKQFSSSCYIFSVVDSSLLIASKQDVRAPYLVLLAKNQLNISCDECDIADGMFNLDISSVITNRVTKSGIYKPLPLSVDEANRHLTFGYYPDMSVSDVRELPGEALVMYTIKNGEPVDVIKVHSISYDWRIKLRDNDPNIGHRFYSLLDTVYNNLSTPEEFKLFHNKYIVYPLYDTQFLFHSYMAQDRKLLTLPVFNYDKNILKNKTVRIYILWLNYLMSLPIPHQLSCLSLFEDFLNDREELVHWLSGYLNSNKDITQLSARANNLFAVSSLSAQRAIDSGNNYCNGTFTGFVPLFNNSIRNFIHKENGNSLYKLLKEMKKEQLQQ
jgi:hypothetical protein